MKGSIACRVLLCLLSLLRPDLLVAQVGDDFGDGDIINGVVWSGDTGAFTVNSGVLKLNSSGSDSSFLAVSLGNVSDTMEWSVQVKLNFAPSSLNYLRIYLSSDQSNLKSALNGYFLQLGETGSADAIVLSRQNGYQITPLVRSRDSIVAQPSEVRCKVVRFPGGLWELWTDVNSTGTYFQEGTIQDNQLQIAGQTGLKCNYTSTNATGFSFDDFYAGTFRRDTVAPFITGAFMSGDSSVIIRFSEPMNAVQLKVTQNYTLATAGYPQTIQLQDSMHTTVLLNFASGLTSFIQPNICVSNITDLAGNAFPGDSCTLVYRFGEAQTGDLLISEIMYDPSDAPFLPEVEYVEIYNRADYSVLIDGWSLSDPASSAVIVNDTIHPGAYRIYCDASLASSLLQSGVAAVKGLNGFPSLNNTGDHLELRDQNGMLIDALTYTPDMYRDPLRDDHGWSLERIDVDFPCHDFYNWKASKDSSGGTPGRVNSANGTFNDTIAVWPVFVFPPDSVHLQIGFSEYPDTIGFQPAGLITISNYLGTIASAEWDPELPQVILELTSPLTPGQRYTINLSHSITDCTGNQLARYDQLEVALPEESGVRQIRLNEILFNPFPDGSDFVEVYNAGNVAVDLSRLKIAHADVLTGLADDAVSFSTYPRLLLPGQYAVATDDISDIRTRYKLCDPRALVECELPSYNDDEGIVVLLDPSLHETERYHYREQHHFPLITDPEGVSLERISMQMTAGDSTNWHSASMQSGFATPGIRNSQSADTSGVEKWLAADPVLFTPNNDGFHDVQQIICKPSRPGFVVHLNILNDQGMTIKTLARQELMGAEALWIWDGTDDSGNRLPPGIYVVIATMFHIDGEVKKYKTVSVIAEPITDGN